MRTLDDWLVALRRRARGASPWLSAFQQVERALPAATDPSATADMTMVVMADLTGPRRAELVDIVRRLQAATGTEDEHDQLLGVLRANVPDPRVSDLIYWPPSVLSPDEIIVRALAYRPFAL